MHELALAGSIFRIAQRVAAGRSVDAIYLKVGVLRQVVPEALVTAWKATSRTDLALKDARLEIELVAAIITCNNCGEETHIDEHLIFACAACGATNYTVKSGEEFLLTQMLTR